MPAGKYQKYKKAWEELPELKDWISPLEGDDSSAFCKVCCRPLHAHKKDLFIHAKTNKHLRNYGKFKSVVDSFYYSDSFSEAQISPMKTLDCNVKQEVAQLNEFDSDSEWTEKNITIAVCPGSNIPDDIETKISAEMVPSDVEEPASITINATSSPDSLFRKLKQAPEFKDWLAMDGNQYSCLMCKKEIRPRRTNILKHLSVKQHQQLCRKMRIPIIQPNDKRVLSLLYGKGSSYEKFTKVIDMRSDTVTVPSKEMKDAMLSADIGDDSFGDDHTVKNLEKKVATLLEKESGLFMPSGTMSNLVAVLTHCSSRDSEVIVGDQSHLGMTSMGGIARMGGILSHTIENEPDGSLSLDSLKTIIDRNQNSSCEITTLVCLENTHNRMGGKALPLDWLRNISEFCVENGVLLHMDGARLLHAAIVCGQPPSNLIRHCHSVSFCLNKGLGAPFGSVLVGSSEFIQRARKIRTELGGTLHQAGFFAAAATFALSNYISRLHVDHANALEIAQCIHDTHSSAVFVDLRSVQSNIVLIKTDNIRLNAKDLCERLMEIRENEYSEIGDQVQILMVPISQTTARFMTHLNLSQNDVTLAIKKICLIIKEYDNMLHISL